MIYYYGSQEGLILKTGFVAKRDWIESLKPPFIRAVVDGKVSDKTMLLALGSCTRTQATDTVRLKRAIVENRS